MLAIGVGARRRAGRAQCVRAVCVRDQRIREAKCGSLLRGGRKGVQLESGIFCRNDSFPLEVRRCPRVVRRCPRLFPPTRRASAFKRNSGQARRRVPAAPPALTLTLTLIPSLLPSHVRVLLVEYRIHVVLEEFDGKVLGQRICMLILCRHVVERDGQVPYAFA